MICIWYYSEYFFNKLWPSWRRWCVWCPVVVCLTRCDNDRLVSWIIMTIMTIMTETVIRWPQPGDNTRPMWHQAICMLTPDPLYYQTLNCPPRLKCQHLVTGASHSPLPSSESASPTLGIWFRFGDVLIRGEGERGAVLNFNNRGKSDNIKIACQFKKETI